MPLNKRNITKERKNMKKLVSLLLALMLIAGIALAEGVDVVGDYVSSLGYTASSEKNRSGMIGCYFTETSKGADALAWSDAKKIYTITGKRSGDALKQLYVELLGMAEWEAGVYYIDDAALYAFNAPDVNSERTYKTLRTFTKAVTDHVGAPAPAPASSKTGKQTYVLSTGTKKFHLPDCTFAKKIKAKNKQKYTGSRDELIAQGYEPCKVCNP